MNIGIVTDFYFPWIGGPSTFIRNLGHGLAARGHEVSVLAPSSSGKPEREREGTVRVTRVRSVPTPFGYQLRSALVPLRAVDQWMEHENVELLHVHHPFALSTTAIFLAAKRRVPTVATNHTIPECSLWGIRNNRVLYAPVKRAFETWLCWLLLRCDAVTTPTATAASALYELGYPREVTAISNGVDTDTFRPGPVDAALLDSLGLDRRPIVLYTGRLDPEKQMDVWLRAAKFVVEHHNVQFVATGKGTDLPRLESLVTELRLENHVRFVGVVPLDWFPSLYRLATLYFITSPVELQSISTLEAIASGLPVVGVSAGALPELIRPGVNGELVVPGDWHECGNTIARLLEQEKLRCKYGLQSRKLAETHGLGSTIDSYESLFRRMTRGGSPVEQAASAYS